MNYDKVTVYLIVAIIILLGGSFWYHVVQINKCNEKGGTYIMQIGKCLDVKELK